MVNTLLLCPLSALISFGFPKGGVLLRLSSFLTLTSGGFLLANKLSTYIFPSLTQNLVKYNTQEIQTLRSYKLSVGKDQQREAFEVYLENNEEEREG